MPQPEGAELDRVREHRDQLRITYLKAPPGLPPTRGIHHVALICRDVEETIGGLQHIALSVAKAQFDAAKRALDDQHIDYLGPDRGVEDSLYLRDPNGAGLELYNAEVGVFNGVRLIDP